MRSVLVLLALAGCGAGPKHSVPAAPVEPGIAPRPYTAEQIRDSMPAGTELRYRLEEQGKPPVILVMKVTAADAKAGTMVSSILAEDGSVVGEPRESTSEWTAL